MSLQISCCVDRVHQSLRVFKMVLQCGLVYFPGLFNNRFDGDVLYSVFLRSVYRCVA